ncbi:MAG: GNAT family N-acetyltransferase [Enterobacterales bacterium]
MIRNATFFDIPEILRLADVYVREEVEPTGHHSAVWDAKMMAHNLMTSMQTNEDIVLLAIEDGQILGYLWAASHCLAPWSPVRVASDYLFYVVPRHRGSRAAIRLVRAYQEWAKEIECAEVRLSVASGIHHDRTEKLYQRLGFTPYASTFNHKP